MTRNPLKDGNISENSAGIGTVTRQMVLGRAEELAIINGSWLHNVSSSDFKQARQQLTGGPDSARQEGILEAAPESEPWDPVAGSTGNKVPVASNDDEDDEGRSDNQRLVEEGVAGAEHDQMVHAARAAASADSRLV
jgi:alkylated DNA nucleotide flippase Atl1